MDWDQIEENWKHAKPRIKEKWANLSDADLDVIDAQRDRLEDRLTRRYGFAEAHVRKEIDDWLRWQTQTFPAPGANRTKLAPMLRRSEI
jgi:uncharacterized protein YjbJ (UPF0337 family)